MTCTDFLAGHSEYFDGRLTAEAADVYDVHLNACPTCRRYHRTVREGSELLRSAQSVEPTPEFRERLRHSIYTIEEEARRRRLPSGGSGVMGIVGVAAVLGILVLTPILLQPSPAVELPQILVSVPDAPVARALPALRAVPPGLGAFSVSVSKETPFGDRDLWTRSNALLYRHSQLYQRRREPSVVQTGLR